MSHELAIGLSSHSLTAKDLQGARCHTTVGKRLRLHRIREKVKRCIVIDEGTYITQLDKECHGSICRPAPRSRVSGSRRGAARGRAGGHPCVPRASRLWSATIEPRDVYRVVSGCRRVYFGMSVSAGDLSHQQRQHWLREQALACGSLA